MRISKELNHSEVIPTEEEEEEYVNSTKDKGGVEMIFIELHREDSKESCERAVQTGWT